MALVARNEEVVDMRSRWRLEGWGKRWVGPEYQHC